MIRYGKNLEIAMPKELTLGFDYYVMQLTGVEERFNKRMAILAEAMGDFYQFSLGSNDRNAFREAEFEMKYGCPIPYSSWWNFYISCKDKVVNIGHELVKPWAEATDFYRRMSLSQGHSKVI